MTESTAAPRPAPVRPVPVPDERSAGYWEAARRGELALARCAGCGAFAHPPSTVCPHCHSAVMCGACGLDWERSKHALFTEVAGGAGCAKALHHLQSNEEADSLARG